MKQLTHILSDEKSLRAMAEEITALPEYQQASCRLQLVFEPNCDIGFLRKTVKLAQNIMPGITCVGMTTTGPITANISVPHSIVSSFLLFEQSDVHVTVFDCRELDPAVAGIRYCGELKSYTNLKGILCVSSCVDLNVEAFIEKVAAQYPDVPLFGEKAGSQVLEDDQSVFFTGDIVCDCGVLAVALCGENLHIKADYNLGWRPIGKKLTVTQSTPDGAVMSIDGKPATSIYSHYLGVVPDEYFFENVCTFPLVTKTDGLPIARSPIGYSEDGTLRFAADLPEGTAIHLAYSKPEYLLDESLAAARRIAAFHPQALTLFACVSRRVLLGDELTEKEFALYRQACPTMAWTYGYCEILHNAAGNGILNSSIVAVAMREGDVQETVPVSVTESKKELGSSSLTLAERLVAFLEATTSELYSTINNLEMLAEHDQLTGIYNRRRMDQMIRYELKKRRREDSLVLLMYDIDFFKRVNDTYGHEAGDKALVDITQCVLSSVREGDTLGRWGGEEFLCMLTGTTLKDAIRVAERIRSNVENTNFGMIGKLTISIGMTSALSYDTAETLFSRADEALYDAKHDGRNCTRIR